MKTCLFLIVTLVASCAGQRPGPAPTQPVNNGATATCDKANLQHEIRTLRASVQAKDKEIAQLAEKINNAPPPTEKPDDPIAALAKHCRSGLVQSICALGLDGIAMACGVYSSQPAGTEPTSGCPCWARRALFIPCEGDDEQ